MFASSKSVIPDEKKGAGVKAIKVGRNPEHPDTSCFVVERSDGSMDFRMVHGVQQLNRYAPRPKVKDAKNLLGYTEGQEGSSGDSAAAEGVEEAGQPEGGEGGEGVAVATPEDGADIVSLWKSKLTLNLVVDHTVYPRNGVPEQVATTMRFHPAKSK